jgi:hypothetical protein
MAHILLEILLRYDELLLEEVFEIVVYPKKIELILDS